MLYHIFKLCKETIEIVKRNIEGKLKNEKTKISSSPGGKLLIEKALDKKGNFNTKYEVYKPEFEKKEPKSEKMETD